MPMPIPYALVRNLFLTTMLFTACVPARKYEEAASRNRTMQAEVDASNAKARDAQAAYDELRSAHDEGQKRLLRLGQDTAVLGTSLRQMTGQYDKINRLNNELLEKYNALMAGQGGEIRKLMADLERTRTDLMVREDSVNALAKAVAQKQALLAELQAELAAKDAAMRNLKDRVSAALTGFEGKGLTVVQRDGRIYVSMENKLLFQSGSYAVDAKGRELIVKLAKAIENEKDLNVLVEGHTDTDRVTGGGALKDNWDLSVMRATSVVRIMQENSRMDPLRVTAAGRGEHIPVDPNDKAKNRRIEIILAPDLKELYNLVK